MIGKWGKCKQCGKDFELKRLSARFCSGKCRTRAYRARKKKGVPSVRKYNTITTSALEDLIAEVESEEFDYTGGQALRELAKRIGAPIRDKRIKEEIEKWRKDMDLTQKY